MWMLRLKGGIEMTEKDIGVWDNVPEDVEIEAVAIAIQRQPGQPPYIVEMKGFNEICLGKLGSAVPGGSAKMIGFVAFCIGGDQVTEFTIRTDGVSLKAYHRDQLTLRPSCLRRMAA